MYLKSGLNEDDYPQRLLVFELRVERISAAGHLNCSICGIHRQQTTDISPSLHCLIVESN